MLKVTSQRTEELRGYCGHWRGCLGHSSLYTFTCIFHYLSFLLFIF